MLKKLTTENSPVILDQFKQYNRIVTDYQDSELQDFLDNAISIVEDHCNISIADHDILLTVEDRKETPLYYNSIKEIASVTDDQGNDIIYTTNVLKNKIKIDSNMDFIVNYKTESSYEKKHINAVINYATLLYNGSTDRNEYNSVLLKCYNPI